MCWKASSNEVLRHADALNRFSNSSRRPSICEYSGFLIFTHVVASGVAVELVVPAAGDENRAIVMSAKLVVIDRGITQTEVGLNAIA